MRIKFIFSILFVCITSSFADHKVIIDTNLWKNTIDFFTKIKEVVPKSNGAQQNFNEIWESFGNEADSVDLLLRQNPTIDPIEYEEGITVTKYILDMWNHKTNNQPDIEINVPVYVYNEVAKGLSSKLGNPSEELNSNVEPFFKSMQEYRPNTHVDFEDLIKGTDYPEKISSKDDKILIKTFKEFLAKNNGKFTALLNHWEINTQDKNLAKKEIIRKKTETKNYLDELNKIGETLAFKKKNWNPKLDKLLKENGKNIYAKETNLLASITGKIKEHSKNKVEKMNFGDANDLIAKRLVKNNEEFDIFDLEIYLYAQEQGAHIMTSNTQAFQEVNDPIFLNFFKDIKILNPSINFETLADLNKPGDCKSVMESALLEDFENERRELTSFSDPYVKISDDCQVESSKLNQMFSEVMSEILGKQTIEVGQFLEENPIFDALDLLKTVDNHLKIDQKQTFASENVQEIKRKMNSLKILDKYIFNSALNVNDFTKATPLSVKEPTMLRDKGVIDAITNSLNAERTMNEKDFCLKEYLKMFKDDTARIDATKLAKALQLENEFSRKTLEDKLSSLNLNLLHGCGPTSSRRKKREAQKCLLTWNDIDEFNSERRNRRDPNKVKINSDEFLDYVNRVEDPVRRQQLYQYVDEKIHSSGKVVGHSIPELNNAINRHKLQHHFSKVGQVSNALNTGLFAKNVLADLLNGNMKGVAVNIGYLAADHALSKVAKLSELKGIAFAASGRNILGNSLKAASPFINRVGSALIVYDLVEQTKH